MSLVSSPSWGLSMEDLVYREGLYYKKFTDIPFTGEIDEGLERGNFKNGKREGPSISYYKNGQLFYEGEYKNGKQEGPWFFYQETGQLKREVNYNDGQRDGPWTIYHNNGQLDSKGEYKNGEIVSD